MSYSDPLGKGNAPSGRRVWSGKNTPSAPQGSSPPRHGEDVESLIDAKFAKWQEEQLASFRRVIGPALPAALPPGLAGTEEVADIALGIDLPHGDTDDELASQAKSVRSIYDLYDNSLCPERAAQSPRVVTMSGCTSKVGAGGTWERERVTSSLAPANRPAPTVGHETLDEVGLERESVISSLAPSHPVLGSSDLPMEVTDSASKGARPEPQSKAVGTHGASSRPSHEGL